MTGFHDHLVLTVRDQLPGVLLVDPFELAGDDAKEVFVVLVKPVTPARQDDERRVSGVIGRVSRIRDELVGAGLGEITELAIALGRADQLSVVVDRKWHRAGEQRAADHAYGSELGN